MAFTMTGYLLYYCAQGKKTLLHAVLGTGWNSRLHVTFGAIHLTP